MNKTYASKIDYWLGMTLLFPIYFAILALINRDFNGLYVTLGTVFFVVFLIKSTNYTIKADLLIVKSMVIVNEKIKIANIKKITKTNTILSSPALSLKRIRITYNQFDEVVISPKNLDHFLSDLRSINPNIITAL